MTLPIGLNFDDNFFYRNGANSFLQRLFASSQIAFSYHNTNRTKTSHVALFRHNFATNDTFVCRSCHPPHPFRVPSIGPLHVEMRLQLLSLLQEQFSVSLISHGVDFHMNKKPGPRWDRGMSARCYTYAPARRGLSAECGGSINLPRSTTATRQKWAVREWAHVELSIIIWRRPKSLFTCWRLYFCSSRYAHQNVWRWPKTTVDWFEI